MQLLDGLRAVKTGKTVRNPFPCPCQRCALYRVHFSLFVTLLMVHDVL